MAEADSAPQSIGQRFPALAQLEEDAERAKLEQALAEARSASVKAKLPTLDVEVSRDVVAVGEKTTGLARVLVQTASVALADDIADITLNTARERSAAVNKPYELLIRVIDDPKVLQDVDVYRLLDERCKLLTERVRTYLPAVPDPALRGFLPIAAVVTLGIQAAALATKLHATDYQISGAEVQVDEMGFDMLLGRYLVLKSLNDESVQVEIDRIMPTPESELAGALWTLAKDGQQRLEPSVASAASVLAEKRAQVSDDEAAIQALDSQIQELVKRVPNKDDPAGTQHLAELRSDREALVTALPTGRLAVTEAAEKYDRGAALLVSLEELLTFALSPSSDSGRSPLDRAARAEALVEPNSERDTYVVYARLIAGGIDQTIATRLIGADRWGTLCGATAEFSLLASGGQLLTSGVRSGFQSSQMKLGSPQTLKQEFVNYTPADRKPN